MLAWGSLDCSHMGRPNHGSVCSAVFCCGPKSWQTRCQECRCNQLRPLHILCTGLYCCCKHREVGRTSASKLEVMDGTDQPHTGVVSASTALTGSAYNTLWCALPQIVKNTTHWWGVCKFTDTAFLHVSKHAGPSSNHWCTVQAEDGHDHCICGKTILAVCVS